MTSILAAEAVQIVTVNEESHSFLLSEEALTKLILKNDVKNRDVVIVSVAGAFRKGKSFLLDFFLRYLYAKVSVAQTLLASEFIYENFSHFSMCIIALKNG